MMTPLFPSPVVLSVVTDSALYKDDEFYNGARDNIFVVLDSCKQARMSPLYLKDF